MAEDTHNQVLAIVANITKKQNNTEKPENEDEDNKQKEKSSSTKPENIRGLPKSGRFWKSQKEKFSNINKTKGLRNSFERKKALRAELQKTKELSKQLLEEIKQKELNRKERRRQNLQRAEENKRKAEVVQVITNTAKLKRMRKKQLRFIEKRDTNKQIEANK
ncbi:coiled-coil domain-containing protein 86 [Helicoverpa zea]|uniref:coiled-coil domain-containing protein 86 n=1 Tax=Helicoverpa zea TaxID=7113 RepID=UPI001F587EFC|nr:coiled-coil domain-containing protein 86 [Helicoverpa zea]